MPVQNPPGGGPQFGSAKADGASINVFKDSKRGGRRHKRHGKRS